jgi:hypothetical protein
MWPASCQPTTIRLKASSTKAKNTSPSQQRSHEMSATQSSFGRSAEKSRSTKSGRRSARGSGLVVRHGLPLRLAPWIPWVRISRWTRPRPTVSPARPSAFHMRR